MLVKIPMMSHFVPVNFSLEHGAHLVRPDRGPFADGDPKAQRIRIPWV
jgi:hypothetical protein